MALFRFPAELPVILGKISRFWMETNTTTRLFLRLSISQLDEWLGWFSEKSAPPTQISPA
jgi:hypothetical protein